MAVLPLIPARVFQPGGTAGSGGTGLWHNFPVSGCASRGTSVIFQLPEKKEAGSFIGYTNPGYTEEAGKRCSLSSPTTPFLQGPTPCTQL